MKRYIEADRSLWPALTARVSRDDAALQGRVAEILARVRGEGDAGLRAVVASIDGTVPADWRVSEAEFAEAEKAVPAALQTAIRAAYARIRTFHEKQRPGEVVWDDGEGILCRRRYLPVGRAGLYVPGGSAPLFSTVLMLAIPAAVAGCRDCILSTPPDKEGRIAPAILFAARWSTGKASPSTCRPDRPRSWSSPTEAPCRPSWRQTSCPRQSMALTAR